MNKLQQATQRLVSRLRAVETNENIISFAELCPTIKLGEDSMAELVYKLSGADVSDELKRFLMMDKTSINSYIMSCQNVIGKYKTNSAIISVNTTRIKEIEEYMNTLRKYYVVMTIIDKLAFARRLYVELNTLISVDDYLDTPDDDLDLNEMDNYMISGVSDISGIFKREPEYVLINVIDGDPDYKNITAVNYALDSLIEGVRNITDLI